MKNIKIISLIFATVAMHALVVAQPGNGNGNTTSAGPTGVVLGIEHIIREVPFDYDAWVQNTDPSSLVQYQTLYIPVQYGEDGLPTAYEYVTATVQGGPVLPPVQFDTTDVLMAYISIPLSGDWDFDKLRFYLGDTPGQGHNLLNTVFHLDGTPNGNNGNNNGTGSNNGAQSNTLVQVLRTTDTIIIVLNLGPDLVGASYYHGELVLENGNGNASTPFQFNTNP
jgi:hypothetical protein